uniref:MDD_C domain-containing protein n=1 Tax=Trichuris muris TaxID=70415 RepID=A0A5S6Q7L8_TRIMR
MAVSSKGEASLKESVQIRAPVNLALVKYWGKLDECQMIPLNDSISITINELFVDTRITAIDGSEDRVSVNGRVVEADDFGRFRRVFDKLRAITGSTKRFHVVSESLFPASAGLASSAAGFSAIAYGLSVMYNLDKDVACELARLGSGSACRSIYPGFVHWIVNKEASSVANRCEVIAEADYWPELCVMVLIGTEEPKHCSSTDGMDASVQTSELLKYRVESCVPKHIKQARDAILERNFAALAEVVMRESDQLHAICLDTYPPLLYLNEFSRQLMFLVHGYNELAGEMRVAYSFDAGCNCFVICRQSEVEQFLPYVCYYFGDVDDRPVVCGWSEELKCTDVLTVSEITEIIKSSSAEWQDCAQLLNFSDLCAFFEHLPYNFRLINSGQDGSDVQVRYFPLVKDAVCSQNVQFCLDRQPKSIVPRRKRTDKQVSIPTTSFKAQVDSCAFLMFAFLELGRWNVSLLSLTKFLVDADMPKYMKVRCFGATQIYGLAPIPVL